MDQQLYWDWCSSKMHTATFELPTITSLFGDSKGLTLKLIGLELLGLFVVITFDTLLHTKSWCIG